MWSIPPPPRAPAAPTSATVQWLHLHRVLPLGKYFLKRVTSVVMATFLFCCFSGRRPRQWLLAPRHLGRRHLVPAPETKEKDWRGCAFSHQEPRFQGGPARPCQTHRTGHSGSSSPKTVGEKRAMWDLRPRRTRRVSRTISPLSIGPFSLHSCEMLFLTGFSLRDS